MFSIEYNEIFSVYPEKTFTEVSIAEYGKGWGKKAGGASYVVHAHPRNQCWKVSRVYKVGDCAAGASSHLGLIV